MVWRRIEAMRPLPAAACILAFAAACTSQHDCNVAGAAPGVSVYVGSLPATAQQPLTVRVCAARTCTTGQVKAADQWAGTSLPASKIGDTSLDVEVTITDASGRQVFEAKTSARPRKWQVNGRGCPPTVYRVWLQTTKDGRLTPRNAPSGFTS